MSRKPKTMMRVNEPIDRPRWEHAALIVLLGCLSLAAIPACSMEQAEMAAPDCLLAGCPEGQTCQPEGGCVPIGETVTIALRVQPQADATLMEQHFTELVVGPDAAPLELTMSQPTLVQGSVFIDAEQAEPAQQARVLFRLRGGIGATPIAREAITDEYGAYELELVPGTYQVTVYLEDSAYPPFRAGDRIISGGTLHLNIALTDPADFFLVQGQLVRMVSDTDTEPVEMPIAGARVNLESVPDGNKVSTSDTTDVEGTFSVQAPPGERDYVIRISPTEENELLPDLTLEQVHISESTDLGVLVVGDWDESVEIGGTVSGLNGEPIVIEAATVFLESQLELGNFSRITLTDGHGHFTERVIPGDYEITIVPPTTVDWAAGSFAQSWHQPDLDQQYDLSQKPVLQGVVMGPDGMGIEGALITAEPTGFTVSSLSLGAVQDETDENGLFQLRVHPGSQLILVIPPPQSDLSPLITSTIDVALLGVQLAVQLQDFGAVSGQIRTPDGAPLAGAIVRIYLEQGDSWVQFLERTTDNQGSFEFHLPAVGLLEP